jgi:multidrug resistance efflux pump
VDVGDPVEYILDVAPGRVFRGTVRSVGYGVNSGVESNPGGLPKVQGSSGWLREPQRFPVIVALDPGSEVGLLRAGGQADVVIYTGRHGLFNVVARLVLRIRSLFTYVR